MKSADQMPPSCMVTAHKNYDAITTHLGTINIGGLEFTRSGALIGFTDTSCYSFSRTHLGLEAFPKAQKVLILRPESA